MLGAVAYDLDGIDARSDAGAVGILCAGRRFCDGMIMQQAFRSGFGAREVGVELPPWMMGSLQVTDTIEVQINGLFVMGLTLLITAGVALLLFRSRWGLQVRSVTANRTMAGAVGIDTRRIDRSLSGSDAALPVSPAALSP